MFRTSVGWKLTEIICAHTLVFDLAEMAAFLDKAYPNLLAGASITICLFCLRRGPCYELTSSPWLRAFIVSRRLPGLTQQRWHALQRSHSNLTNDWEVLLISVLFVFPDWCRRSLGGCCAYFLLLILDVDRRGVLRRWDAQSCIHKTSTSLFGWHFFLWSKTLGIGPL